MRDSDRLIGMGDLELLQHAYALVPRLEPFPELDRLADELYFALDEILERFAPELARAECEASHDAGDRLSGLAAIERRAAARKIADALDERRP